MTSVSSRHVALKVLPDAVVADPERTARFQREAKVLASLSHPHIAALFGFEEDTGRSFLTMEMCTESRHVGHHPEPRSAASVPE